MHLLKTLIQNLGIQSLFPGNLTGDKIEDTADDQTPHNCIDAEKMDIIVAENVCGNSSDGADDRCLPGALFPEEAANQATDKTWGDKYQQNEGKNVNLVSSSHI